MKLMNNRNLGLLLVSLLLFVSCEKKDLPPELMIGSSEALFTAEGGTSELNVVSNTSWNVENNSPWVSVSPSNSNGTGKITLTVQPNPSQAQRTAVITVSAGNISKELKVRQLAKPVADSIAPDPTGMRDISSIELAKEMKIGWNAGNSLDAIGSETAWGNPRLTQRLIDSIKQAGFNAVRLPVAWSKFTNAPSFTIDTAWMARVEEVVNYVLKNGMYAIVNIHWDGGWMQPTYAKQQDVSKRLAVMWKQIAIRFRDYDDHLLFAGTNEVMVEGDYSTPKQEYYTVQNSFNQTFVSTIRSTGGRNSYRHLVVQGFNTNIDHTVSFFTMPDDPVDNRLMVEVHYYDPFNFTLNENTSITQWGKNANDPSKVETWANEAHADGQFQKMKAKFIDNGYAVILGEYGAIARLNLQSDAANAEYAEYRRYYMEYITKSAVDHGLIPFYWDNGFTGDKGMGIFDRNTGGVIYPEIVRAIIGN
jgi:endoglucanase